MTSPAMTDAQCDVLRRALDHVLAHPAEFRQAVWGYRYPASAVHASDASERVPACGTAYCVAGHVAVTVLGALPVWDDDYAPWNGGARLVGILPVDPAFPTGYDALHDVEAYARRALGLPLERANRLFSGGNSLRRVAELAFLYSAGRVDVLRLLPPATSRELLEERSDAVSSAHRAWTELDRA